MSMTVSRTRSLGRLHASEPATRERVSAGKASRVNISYWSSLCRKPCPGRQASLRFVLLGRYRSIKSWDEFAASARCSAVASRPSDRPQGQTQG